MGIITHCSREILIKLYFSIVLGIYSLIDSIKTINLYDMPIKGVSWNGISRNKNWKEYGLKSPECYQEEDFRVVIWRAVERQDVSKVIQSDPKRFEQWSQTLRVDNRKSLDVKGRASQATGFKWTANKKNNRPVTECW